jgi:hypothetical protein
MTQLPEHGSALQLESQRNPQSKKPDDWSGSSLESQPRTLSSRLASKRETPPARRDSDLERWTRY